MSKKSFFVKSSAFAFGIMLMAACTNVDSPVIIDEPTEVETVPVDVTVKAKLDAASWGSGTGTYAVSITTADGRTSSMAEHYYGGFPCDETPLKQVIEGLENGSYEIVLNATTNLAWISSDVVAGATDVAFVYAQSGANKVTEPIEAGRETGFSVPGEYTLNIDVTDGTLELGLGLLQTSMTNWHTIQVKSITLQMPVDKAYETILPEAQELAGKTIAANLKEELDAAIAAPQSADNYYALIEAISAAKVSAASYELIAAGSIADDKLDNWTCTTGNTFHINTWSVEGNTDGTGMVTPFIEDWRNAGEGTLGDGEIAYTLAGLTPGEKITVSALIRAYSEAGNAISGGIFFVGSEKVSLSDGHACEAGAAKGVFNTYSATGTVGTDGVLKFGVSVSSATFNWIAIKSVTLRK